MTSIQFVPANGSSAVEIDVYATGKPARVEVYAMASQLADLQ
jgi:hypothetical protein